MLSNVQKTILKPAQIRGVGLHSGVDTNLELRKRITFAEKKGIVFDKRSKLEILVDLNKNIDAYSVVFNSLEEINLGTTNHPGIILSEENTLTIEIFNESGYTQDYQYIFNNDDSFFFDSVNEIITIEANESIILTFQGGNIETNDFTEIDFTVIPINHQYAEKQFHFYVSKSNNISFDFKILKIYPNPFNASSEIIFDVPYQSELQVAIYNIKGQLLDILLNETKDEGRYIVEWNAQNYSSGVYFITMTSQDFIETQKVTLIK